MILATSKAKASSFLRIQLIALHIASWSWVIMNHAPIVGLRQSPALNVWIPSSAILLSRRIPRPIHIPSSDKLRPFTDSCHSRLHIVLAAHWTTEGTRQFRPKRFLSNSWLASWSILRCAPERSCVARSRYQFNLRFNSWCCRSQKEKQRDLLWFDDWFVSRWLLGSKCC